MNKILFPYYSQPKKTSKLTMPNYMKSCILFLLFLISLPIVVSAADTQDKSFVNFINNSSDGNWFDQAILLKNKCDFSSCRSRKCAVLIFNETIFKQECDYASSVYGPRGKNWEVTGSNPVEANIFSNQRYYDDLGVNVFSTGENIVLHFDITSSVDLLRDFEYKKLGSSWY